MDEAPIPAEEWEQQGPVAGAIDGQSPDYAIFVAPVGIGTVREVPCLAGSGGSIAASANKGTGQVVPLLSASPQRRGVMLGGLSGTPRVSQSLSIAQIGGGLPIPTGANPIYLPYAGELYVYFPTDTDAIGFFALLDQD